MGTTSRTKRTELDEIGGWPGPDTVGPQRTDWGRALRNCADDLARRSLAPTKTPASSQTARRMEYDR